MKVNSGIYIIKNIVNGKIYIGSSVNVFKRWTQHRYKLNKGNHANKHLQRAWNKYGISEFEFSILELINNPNKEILIELEQKYLDEHKSFNKDVGYNILKKADSSLGVEMTKETKNKLSLIMKEKWSNGEYKQNMIDSFNYKRDNIASAKKISKTRKDKGLFKGENNPMYGTCSFEVWKNKYGLKIAIKKKVEADYKNSESNKGENNAMFRVKRPKVANKNKELKSKLVLLFDADNNLVESYKSITETADNSNFSRSSIKKSLYNKIFVKNNIWKYGK